MQKRRRRRRTRSCVECYRRKIKCDRKHPCGQCTAHGAAESCTYEEYRDSLGIDEVSTANSKGAPSTLQDRDSVGSSPSAPSTSGQIHGVVSKSRVFGQGHWMNASSLVSRILLARCRQIECGIFTYVFLR